MKKIIYYVNQYFGGIGGEEKAFAPLDIRNGAVGPALAFLDGWGEGAEISHTIICGDNYFNENKETVLSEIKTLIEKESPDLFIAGPAFNAGRYGLACGAVCAALKEEFGLKVLTGMYPGNPAVSQNKKDLYIAKTSDNAKGMKAAIASMILLGKKLLSDEPLGSADSEGYIPRGFRLNELADMPGAVRAVSMLHKKLAGEFFETEVRVDKYEEITPAPPIKNLSKATIAFVTEAGVVPLGNPDRIKHASAVNWAKYSLEGVDDLIEGAYEGVHGGFDARYCNADPDRILPVDALRYFEKIGYIGKMHEIYYSTVGNGTSIESCKRFGAEIVKELQAAKVDGVLLPSS